MENRLNNATDKVVGKVKDTAGKILDDQGLEFKGKMQTMKADTSDRMNDMKDNVEDKFNHMKSDLKERTSNLKEDMKENTMNMKTDLKEFVGTIGAKTEDVKDDIMESANHLMDKVKSGKDK